MSQQTPRTIQSIEIDFYNPKGKNAEFPEFGKYVILSAAFLVTIFALFIWNWMTTNALEETKTQTVTNQSLILDLQAQLTNQNAKISMEHWSNVPNALHKEKPNVRQVLSDFADYLPADSSVSELKITAERKVAAKVSFGSLRSMVQFRDALRNSKHFDLVNIGDYKRDIVPQANTAENGIPAVDTAYEPVITLHVEVAVKPSAYQEGGTP